MRGELFFRKRKAPLALPEKKPFGEMYIFLSTKTSPSEENSLLSSEGPVYLDMNPLLLESVSLKVALSSFMFLKKMVIEKQTRKAGPRSMRCQPCCYV